MSAENALQRFVFERLVADDTVSALVGDRIVDRSTDASLPMPYVSFGPSDAVDDSAECVDGTRHVLQLDIWSQKQSGFRETNAIRDAVRKALRDTDGTMDDYAIVEVQVVQTRAFRDPDGLTTHGVVVIEAMIEETS